MTTKDLPEQKRWMNFSALKRLCREHVEAIGRGEHNPDMETAIYTEAMNAVYGQGIWRWIEDRISEK